jgi:hypothetical protein
MSSDSLPLEMGERLEMLSARRFREVMANKVLSDVTERLLGPEPDKLRPVDIVVVGVVVERSGLKEKLKVRMPTTTNSDSEGASLGTLPPLSGL